MHHRKRILRGMRRHRRRAVVCLAAGVLVLAAAAAGAYLMKKDSADGRRLMWKVHRLPGRIYPYYLLARLYGETGAFPRRKLEWAVRRVTETEPKVHSTAVREMREQVRRMMEELE